MPFPSHEPGRFQVHRKHHGLQVRRPLSVPTLQVYEKADIVHTRLVQSCKEWLNVRVSCGGQRARKITQLISLCREVVDHLFQKGLERFQILVNVAESFLWVRTLLVKSAYKRLNVLAKRDQIALASSPLH